MKKVLFCFCISLLYASENKVLENYPQKQLDLNAKQKQILEESITQQKAQKRQKNTEEIEPIKGSIVQKNGRQVGERDQREDDKVEKGNSRTNAKGPKTLNKKDTYQKENEINHFNPYVGFKKTDKTDQKEQIELNFKKQWVYGTAVITTTFLNGSIKRSYGVLLRDGMFVTSANMVYDKNVYARESYAMMQDDSSIPFICVAKLSVKALDLQKGLAILETLSYTDIYCNERSKSYYHDRIYSGYWVDVFTPLQDESNPIVYSPYITKLNSFATQKHILRESLEQLAIKEGDDFEGYKYAYGKGFYTFDGRLLGIVGASQDNLPKFIKTEEISSFLCELKDRKILKNPYLQATCPSPKKKD